MSFDTSSKIITLEQARSAGPASAFVTHMEVLRPDHIRKLEELAARKQGSLCVILTDPDSPLSPMEARAEIAAALRIVDYVVPSPEGAAAALAVIQPAVIVHDEEEDRERARLLIEHVRSRSAV